jgi:hypothetical protein
VVLFYSIPAQFISPVFNEGIIYYIIIVSSLIMMLGLMFTKTEFSEERRIILGEKSEDADPSEN